MAEVLGPRVLEAPHSSTPTNTPQSTPHLPFTSAPPLSISPTLPTSASATPPPLLPSPSSKSNHSSVFCRICHEGELAEALISPCGCSGSVGVVHQSCLEKWLSAAQYDTCELCRQPLRISRHHRPLVQWLCGAAEGGEDQRNLVGDLVCLVLLTPLAVVSAFLCTTGARYYTAQGQAAEAAGLVCLCAVLGLVYLLWLLLTARYHCQVWYKWRGSHQEIRLVRSSPPRRPAPRGRGGGGVQEAGGGEQGGGTVVVGQLVNTDVEVLLEGGEVGSKVLDSIQGLEDRVEEPVKDDFEVVIYDYIEEKIEDQKENQTEDIVTDKVKDVIEDQVKEHVKDEEDDAKASHLHLSSPVPGQSPPPPLLHLCTPLPRRQWTGTPPPLEPVVHHRPHPPPPPPSSPPPPLSSSPNPPPSQPPSPVLLPVFPTVEESLVAQQEEVPSGEPEQVAATQDYLMNKRAAGTNYLADIDIGDPAAHQAVQRPAAGCARCLSPAGRQVRRRVPERWRTWSVPRMELRPTSAGNTTTADPAALEDQASPPARRVGPPPPPRASSIPEQQQQQRPGIFLPGLGASLPLRHRH